MAGRNIKGVHAVVTAATSSGFLTVSSAVGLYVGAFCWLSNTAGTVQDYVEITEITGTSVGVRKIPARGSGPTYGRSDVSSYNAGGFLDQEEQFIYNRNQEIVP
jgi:hypothetical protein